MIRWSHAALNCRDIDATERFYTNHFGFSRANAFDLGELKIVFLRLGESYLELFGPAQPLSAAATTEPIKDGPERPGQVRHIAFQTDDVDQLLRRMGPDARITLGPLDFDGFIHGWRTAWITDPDGVVVEVSQGYRDAPTAAGAGHV